MSLSLLILFECSLCFLICVAKGLLILLNFSENQLSFVFFFFFFPLTFSIHLFISAVICIIYFCFLILNLVFSSFSSM